MEEVTGSANLNRAYKRVKANGGAAGVDGMDVSELRAWIADNRERLIASLLDGSYRPQPVRGVQIPKPGGGMRQLAFQPWWIGWCSRRSHKSWNRGSIRRSPIELRLSPRTRRARCAATGPGIRGRRV